MDREERNKFLAGYVGEHWHKFYEATDRTGHTAWICNCQYRIQLVDIECELIGFPDYHTAEGRQRLLEWAVNEEWWGDFVAMFAYPPSEDSEENPGKVLRSITRIMIDPNVPIDLLIPESALAEAVYKYLIKKEN